MSSKRVKNLDFSYILDRLNLRFAGWKSKISSRSGHATLVKSMLNSIPIYSMQNFWIPQGVFDATDRTSRSFIWGSRHHHWVGWEKISQPLKDEGLGICNARETNIALSGKHVWSILHEHQQPWVNMVSHKYLKGEHVFRPREFKGCSYKWSSIIKPTYILELGFRF